MHESITKSIHANDFIVNYIDLSKTIFNPNTLQLAQDNDRMGTPQQTFLK